MPRRATKRPSSARVARPAGAGGRPRTQEERSLSTRAKILAAATESVAELGLRGATMSAIAERAGVSWGAIIEIQMGRSRAPSKESKAWSKYLSNALSEIWNGLFGDLGLDGRRLGDMQRFTFAVLSGIAAEVMLFPGNDFTRRHLEILEETLVRLLELEP